MADIKTVMISSTVRDLPDHRDEVREACLRQGMFPVMMDHLPASDADAISASMEMVEDADIYVGVYAHRYGYSPEGHDISITEMEYDRAVAQGIPRMIFIMHNDHTLRAEDVETGGGAAKLDTFKNRLKKDNIVNFFKSPEDLRAHALHSLAQHKADLTAKDGKGAAENALETARAFHYVSDIPEPPEVYIAHPYTLLQTHDLVGRQDGLNLLTDWVAKPEAEVYRARVLNVVALGGVGKSALTWKWFSDIAPQEMRPLAGRMWWSFYESDAHFENFVLRALAYVTGQRREQVEELPAPERVDALVAALDREPFLLVLDGLERILVAYARMDAAHLADEDVDAGQHRLRRAADPRAGAILRRLAGVQASRILVSTRLYPAALETAAGEPMPGSFHYPITGLSDDDALGLWRPHGVTGSREVLLPVFNSFENHPLLLQALAGEVARYRPAPRDFDRWRQDHPDFDPFSLPLESRKTHVLEFALRGLEEAPRRVLHTMAAFRMPATYDTLNALFVGEGRPFGNERGLDGALSELEDRGLLGWNRQANRYDLHPIVRGVAWSGLADGARRDIYGSLHAHFEAMPAVEFDDVSHLEDLTPAIELYSTLVGLGRYDDAHDVFGNRIDHATLYGLSASRQRAELLEMLFPDGTEGLPRLSDPSAQAYTLNSLGLAYQNSGQQGQAVPLFLRHIAIREEQKDPSAVAIGLHNLSDALHLAGSLREAEAAARRALAIGRDLVDQFQEAVSLHFEGLTMGARGVLDGSETALRRSLRLFEEVGDAQPQARLNVSLAQRALWMGDPATARTLADRAWDLAYVRRVEIDFISAARVQGLAALGLNDLETAEERLSHALARARAVDFAEEELPALLALGELRRLQGSPDAARQLLEDVWDPADLGPYPLFHADTWNVLASIERDAGNKAAAVEAATAAYRLAWCDGPPFAYHWGLEAAKAHLAELGAREPDDLPPYDESQYDPMPEVEIDPQE